MVDYRTHEEVMASRNQVEHKLDMMKFMTIGAGCLMAMPLTSGLIATGLFAAGMYGVAKAAQKHFHVEQTYNVFMALHREKDIQSTEYKQLAKIAKQFEKIEDMSFSEAHALGEKVKELREAKNYRTYQEFAINDSHKKHSGRVLKFAALGAGCMIAAPFTPVLTSVGLVVAGTASLVLSLKHKFFAKHNGELLTALTKQENIHSEEYQKLSNIADEYKKVGIENLSMANIMDRVSAIRDIIKGNNNGNDVSKRNRSTI